MFLWWRNELWVLPSIRTLRVLRQFYMIVSVLCYLLGQGLQKLSVFCFCLLRSKHHDGEGKGGYGSSNTQSQLTSELTASNTSKSVREDTLMVTPAQATIWMQLSKGQWTGRTELSPANSRRNDEESWHTTVVLRPVFHNRSKALIGIQDWDKAMLSITAKIKPD